MNLETFQDVRRVLKTYESPTGRSKETYTLDRMKSLMEFLGNPQDQLKVLHVAGTSGKTSTAYYAAALLQAKGLRVGLTVSPHVDEVNERVQINLEPLAEAVFCKELEAFLALIANSQVRPSYFELLVAFAYWEFARQKVDYAVIEVGLGGLLDGTNVIDRADKICLVTDIGLDHVNVLGSTLAEIATQKAGIILPENEVFIHEQPPEVMQVVQTTGEKQRAHLNVVADAPQPALRELPRFQQRNASLAIAAVNVALKRSGIKALDEQEISSAVSIRIPARMEIINKVQKTIILDGSHNGQKLHALVDAVLARYDSANKAVLVSFASGDEYRLPDAFKEVSRLSHQIIITSFSGSQDSYKTSVDLQTLEKVARENDITQVQVITDPKLAFEALINQPADLYIVTGSFYLLNHIRPLIMSS